MKQLLLIIFLSASGCYSMQPIKGKYPEPPFQMETKQSFDKVWEKVVDVFSERNIPIKIIDKNSGIIVSEKVEMVTTGEDRKGVLLKKTAFIVVPSYYDPGAKKITTTYLIDSYKGSITVRVKQRENEILVVISISEVTAQSYMNGKIENGTNITYKSTGVFEKMFFDLIK
jgi:hypothetical protein